MRKIFIFLFTSILITFGILNLIFAQTPMIFCVPDFPPVTFEKDSKLQGSGIEMMSKIMKEAKIDYKLVFVPTYDRAINEMIEGNADGFCMASQNAKRDEVAVKSNPVLNNKWSWFIPNESKLNPADPSFKTTAKIGTLLNTNTHKWLVDNKYQVTGSPTDHEALIKMLQAKRIDAVFVAEEVFLDALKQQQVDVNKYKIILEQNKPLGIYVSKEYLKKNPETIARINAAISKLIKL